MAASGAGKLAKATDAMAKRAAPDAKKSVVARAREKMTATSQRTGADAKRTTATATATISVTPPQPIAAAAAAAPAAAASASAASAAAGAAAAASAPQRQPQAAPAPSAAGAAGDDGGGRDGGGAGGSVALEVEGVPRNARGGVFVDRDELHQAFEFFDQSGSRAISIGDLKERLGVFYQNLSSAEYKYLMNNRSRLTEQELYDLLCDNELTDYDPVEEAFKIYAKGGPYLDRDVFRDVLTNLGFAHISEADIQTLIETADVDGDGKVGLRDFRLMLQNHKKQHTS